jgi:hypothetical protein
VTLGSVFAFQPEGFGRRWALLEALGGIGGNPDAAAFSGGLKVGNQFAVDKRIDGTF